jgi:hypothetical protein
MPCTTPPCNWPATHRVDHCSEIVDAGVAHNVDDARFRIDLDFGNVAAIGERRGHRARRVIDVERGGHTLRHLAFAQTARELHDVDRAVRAGDGETAVGKVDIAFRGFHQMRRSALALFDDEL